MCHKILLPSKDSNEWRNIPLYDLILQPEIDLLKNVPSKFIHTAIKPVPCVITETVDSCLSTPYHFLLSCNFVIFLRYFYYFYDAKLI